MNTDNPVYLIVESDDPVWFKRVMAELDGKAELLDSPDGKPHLLGVKPAHEAFVRGMFSALGFARITGGVSQELIDGLRQHSIDHYTDGGWDVVYECWEDAQIAGLLAEAGAKTPEEAVKAFSVVVGVWAEWQAGARNERRAALGEDARWFFSKPEEVWDEAHQEDALHSVGQEALADSRAEGATSHAKCGTLYSAICPTGEHPRPGLDGTVGQMAAYTSEQQKAFLRGAKLVGDVPCCAMPHSEHAVDCAEAPFPYRDKDGKPNNGYVCRYGNGGGQPATEVYRMHWYEYGPMGFQPQCSFLSGCEDHKRLKGTTVTMAVVIPVRDIGETQSTNPGYGLRYACPSCALQDDEVAVYYTDARVKDILDGECKSNEPSPGDVR